MIHLYSYSIRVGTAALLLGAAVALAGCDTKREVVDIETPAGELEVNEDTSTGDVEVDVTEYDQSPTF